MTPKLSSLLVSCSTVAVIATLFAGPALAQADQPVPAGAQGEAQASSGGNTAPSGDQGQGSADQAGGAGQEIVVTGVRASLRSAQNIKRNATQVVDSIVAEDIGKLPDRNIAEALQRVSGIQIQRSYGEGSGIAIRGLTQVRTELNGRDVFTANGGNDELSLEDVPSELLAGVDVYKNPSADLIENQLSGTINFRTRKPFDFDGFKVSGAVTQTGYDLANKTRPSASILISDRWDTGIGEIGILASVSYQKTAFRQDTISTEPFYTLDQSLKADGTANSPADALIAAQLGRTGQTTTLPHGTGIGEVYGNRRRFGTDVAIQWKPTDTLELTGEVFRNDYKFRFDDFSYFAYTSNATITPLAGAPFTFADNGDMISGSFADLPIGANTSLETRHSRTTDYSFNAKWHPSERLTVTGDLQYEKSTTQDLRSIVGLNGQATTLVQDLSGSIPSFNITSAAGLTNAGTYGFDDAHNSFYLDDLNHSRSTDKTGRLDAEYKFDGGILSSIRAGIRYADRRNNAADTGYRYTGISGVLPDLEYVDLSDFFRGQTPLFGNALFFSRSITKDYDATRATIGVDTLPTYLPSGSNAQRRKTYAGYAAAFFKADQLPVPVDGNIGVRVVRTEDSTSGFYQVVNLVTGPGGVQSTGETTFDAIDFSRSYTSVLPSLNLRGRITDQLQLRLAASKNIFRPTFGQINPSLSITEPGAAQINQEHDATGGNPFLKQMKSDDFDASLEWYFSRTGSLTAAGFYKHIDDYIQTAITPRTVTFNDGVSAVYQVTSYNNIANAKVKGFEVAYQQFFDFLPGLLSGLGMQANFTYVSSDAPSPATAGPVTRVPLEGLSKYNYNLIGIYEKGKISARVAYNWRSKFLVTTSGNGSGNLPVFQKAFGQLDASITFNVTPHFSLTLDGVNVADTRTSTYYGITTRPRDSILNDRRLSGIARITF